MKSIGASRAYPPAVIAPDCLLAARIDGTTAADSVRRLGDSANASEITTVFTAMRSAVDNALGVLCRQ